MEIIDSVEVFSRLDELRTAVFGNPVKILPDTFLLKFDKNHYRFGNGYVLKHRNQRDLVLIDAVKEEHRETLQRYVENGFKIKAILITHRDLLEQAYKPVKDIARDLDTNYFIHPLDSNGDDRALDITGYHDTFKAFDLSIFHLPGHTNGSVVIYCGLNKALFTGDSAVGSEYGLDEYYFERPPMESAEKDLALRESWKSLSVDFAHILPLHGKPQFDLSSEQKNQIIISLTKKEQTENL
ncbi:MAG: MBL fold metallo-hydrolase [Nonlabens sp.]